MPYQHVGGILVFSNKNMSNNNIQLPKRGFPGDYIIHIKQLENSIRHKCSFNKLHIVASYWLASWVLS